MEDGSQKTYFERTPRNAKYWSERDFVSDPVRDGVLRAGIVLYPWEGFRDHDGPVFPVGTQGIYEHLRENAPDGVEVEIAVDDEAYVELALHGALLIIGGVLVGLATGIAMPVAANLITEAVKARYPKFFAAPDPEDRVRIQLTVDDGQRSITATVEAAPEFFEPRVKEALRKMEEGDILDAEWVDAEEADSTSRGASGNEGEGENEHS